MHLVPPERRNQRVIDEETVCTAIAALAPPAVVASWAERFAVLGDPTRLSLLLCIRAAGPISVSDLAVATGISDTTVSQSLRHLRAEAVVRTQREGRIIRYRLSDTEIEHQLDELIALSRVVAT
jgi:DNA-binding transcriptional ArsR family regulator